MLYVLKPERGLSLIELMIGLGLLGLLFAAIGLMSSMTGGFYSGIHEFSVIQNYKSKLISSLRNNGALQNSANNNFLPCITSNLSCNSGLSPGVATPFKVFDFSGQIQTDPTNSKQGFNDQGQICNSFGKGNCIFRYETTITAICSNAQGTCQSPQYMIKGELKVSDALKQAELAYFGAFQVLLGELTLSQESYCKSAGGNFIGGLCIMPFAGLCPNGQAVVGVNTQTNTKICMPIYQGAPYTCPPGTVFKGISSTGTAICPTIQCPVKYIPPCYIDPSLCGSYEPVASDSVDSNGIIDSGGGSCGGGVGGVGGCGAGS